MQIQTNIPLNTFSTMRLGGNAKYLVTVHAASELQEAVQWASQQQAPILVLGGGSNIIFTDGFDGLVIINRIHGFEVLQNDPLQTIIRIGAGENWDDVVSRTTSIGLTGIEALSAIPGTAGATPVQNVGAYGQEIADTFLELQAYDLTTNQFIVMDKAACQFSYRSSIFKPIDNRRYIIVAILLRLHKGNPEPPFYNSLQKYLTEHNITEFTPQIIRAAVIAIRAEKLPDPTRIANTGSFFKNPIISREEFVPIELQHPHIPFYETDDSRIKLLAGWLIEQTGLKGYADRGMKVYDKNALVLVNEHAQSYADLAAFRDDIIAKVHERFGVTLQQEPELL
jgi:UDP-N-acetylmuramate dehydrogenase